MDETRAQIIEILCDDQPVAKPTLSPPTRKRTLMTVFRLML
jgi:hypothetical protein